MRKIPADDGAWVKTQRREFRTGRRWRLSATVLIEKICDFGIAERSTVDSDLIHQTAEVLADFVGTRA